MQIIEQQVIGKRGAELCEDAIVVTDHFIAVLDGSTSKSKLPPLRSGRTPGQEAVNIVSQLIRAADPMFDLWTFCHHATEMITMTYEINYGRQMLPHLFDHPEDRICCSAIIYSRHLNEVWMIGDCHGLILDLNDPADRGMHITNPKPHESRLARMRSEFLTKALQAGALSPDEVRERDMGREFILPHMLEAMQQQNRTYAVIDGFPIPLRKVKVFGNFISGVNELVLASDGYPRLFPTLEKTEAYLQQCLQADPLFIRKCKATKGCMQDAVSFDDRAYIRFRI